MRSYIHPHTNTEKVGMMEELETDFRTDVDIRKEKLL